MKKIILLLGSIVSFLISLFFLLGVIVFVGNYDLEGVFLSGIPLILFGALFCSTFKKYLKLINFTFKDFILKWRTSKFLRITDLAISCFLYVFVLLSDSVIPIILALLFGGLYLIKPLLGSKVDLSNLKNKKVRLIFNIILVILITIIAKVYLEYTVVWEIGNLFLDIIETIGSGLDIEKVVYLYLYWAFKFLFREAITVLMVLSFFLSLILYIDNCFNNSKSKERLIKRFNIYGVCYFIFLLIMYVTWLSM